MRVREKVYGGENKRQRNSVSTPNSRAKQSVHVSLASSAHLRPLRTTGACAFSPLGIEALDSTLNIAGAAIV